jgi:hypothetical protein
MQLRKVRAEYAEYALELERDLSLALARPPAKISRKAIHRGA